MTLVNNSTWRRIVINALGLAFVIVMSSADLSAAQDACADFARTVKTTYNFRPALLSDSERTEKSAAMDVVWEKVKGDPSKLLPCLRKELEDSKANAWFRFDGSNLLVSLDPSPSSKNLLIQSYAATNLDDVDLRVFVSRLAQLGEEGFDVSAAGARWLAYPKAEYYLPLHGSYKVSKLVGAFFIYGSMEENQATPALLKIASDENHGSRELALAILLSQATPEAFKALKEANKVGRSENAKSTMLQLLANPRRFEPRSSPKTSREEFLKAFNAFVSGDWKPLASLTREVPDGERDVVAVLKAEDVPLVRRVRRKMISNATPHAFDFYKSFSEILMTMVWRPELVK